MTMDLITTQLGRFRATGKGFITRGLPGTHNATVTVTGAGAVSATVVIRGGNSEAAMVTIATVNVSGTGSAAASRSWTEDYRFWEVEVTALTGELVSVDCVSEFGEGASSPGGVVGGGVPSLGGVFLVFGDSTSGNGFIPSNDNGTTAQNLFAQACAELGAPFDTFINGGVSGQNTEEILARLPAALDMHNPSVVGFGPNSVNDFDDVFTPERSIAADTEAVRLAVAHPSVRFVLVCTVHPTDSMNSETASATGARARKWRTAVNANKWAMEARWPGRVFVVDVASAVAAANGAGMVSGYSPDGTHFGYAAAAAVNRLAAKPTLSKLVGQSWRRPSDATDPSNILGPAASVFQGDNATGSAGTVLLPGITGQLPNGLTGRRASGDNASTATVSSIASPVGYDGRSAQAQITIGADGLGAGITIGRDASARNNYDNARANSTAYTWGEKIAISSTLNGQVFSPGTSAASSPDFTGAEPGDMVTDGTVTWLVTRRPLPGQVVEFYADMSLAAQTGQLTTGAWINIINTSAVGITRWMHFAGQGAYSYPTAIDGARRAYRHRFTIPADWTGVRTIQFGPIVQGKAGATCTLQVHSLSAQIVG